MKCSCGFFYLSFMELDSSFKLNTPSAIPTFMITSVEHNTLIN